MYRNSNKDARMRALKTAWDPKLKAFRCHYTGVVLEEEDHKDPLYLTFDHRTPRQEDDIVIAAACINDMKSDLTEDEFKSVVKQLARRFNGEDFDETVLKFACWKR